MKNLIIGLFTLGALTLTLQAYDKTERRQDMQTMEVSMAQIQKGILSNNKKMILQGVENLKEVSNKIEVPQKEEMDYSPKYAKDQAIAIVKFADEIKEKTQKGHKHSAAASYTKVLDKCISCHNKLRKWK